MTEATPDASSGRERDLERLLTFVDAVVAIAMTLLVLPLVDLAGRLGDGGSVAHLLPHHGDDLVAFFISFSVIARQWFAQHGVVRPLVKQDRVVVWCLMFWLLAIVFVPFPTSLIAQSGEDPLSKVLYLGTMAAASLLLAGAAGRIAATPEIRDGDPERGADVSIVTAATFLITLAISLAVPRLGYLPLFLLLLTDQWVALWHRLRRGGSRRAPVGE